LNERVEEYFIYMPKVPEPNNIQPAKVVFPKEIGKAIKPVTDGRNRKSEFTIMYYFKHCNFIRINEKNGMLLYKFRLGP